MKRHKTIVGVRSIIKRKRQLVVFDLDDGKFVFINFAQIKQNIPNIEVYELELLIGCLVRLEFYSVGEKLPNERICDKEECLLKEYYIELKSPLDTLRAQNEHLLKNFLEIKELFSFERNGITNIGIKTNESDKPIFLRLDRLARRSGLDVDELHILLGSYLYVEYFKIGEDLGKAGKAYTETIVKNFTIRYKDRIEKMHESFEENSLEEFNKVKDRGTYIPYYKEMGYSSTDDLNFHDVFDGEIDAWNAFND